MLPIKGLQKTSLIDYVPNTSCVVFIGGCNFRCGYCHNHDLVLNFKDIPTLSEKEICDFVESRKKWLDAVVITGGEPTMYPELIDLVREIKKLGMKVKLDTNGTNPKLLWDMLEEKLLDYIAMDIKAPLHKYENIAMRTVDTDKIKESIELIKNAGIDYEFRTTIMPSMLKKDDMLRIAELLEGTKRYAIQQYRESGGILDKALEGSDCYSKEELEEIKEMMEKYIDEVLIRVG